MMMVVGLTFSLWLLVSTGFTAEAKPTRIIVDTDVNSDDILALFYLLKQNRAEIDLQGITINTNGWIDAGHGVNYLYDILFMMGRDDIPVGVGGEGEISSNGTISPNVGGYLPLIDQEMSTAGGCRYRQAIPVGAGGRLDVNSNFGLRKGYLPQGERRYRPVSQLTSQQVMINAASKGPVTVLLMGAHTNFAVFLLQNPHLKKNIQHIYAMGGAIRPDKRSGRIGNLSPGDSDPYAEYNIFVDPFAAYLVLHSGIPVTLVPLDATQTIPVTKNFFSEFERRHDTYEAEYSFRTLQLVRDSWGIDTFYEQFCMWDAFMVGIAVSVLSNPKSVDGENEFAEMEYVDITVVTSNEPYGISDGSNPLAEKKAIGSINVEKNGVHCGHVQMGLLDPFCLTGHKGKCQDAYTKEVTGSDAVRVLVATKAKRSKNGSLMDKRYYKHFLDVLNRPERSGRFNMTTQFPHYKEVLFKPESEVESRGKPVVFDMDMSAGDFLALLYLLKLPMELIDLKGVLITSTGWANSATVDVVYDILHMMGRDDIPVGLGDEFSIGEAFPIPGFSNIGGCKYRKAIPQGSGGFLDSDTLYGLARDLPRSPRRYSAESLDPKSASRRNNELPEVRQPLALDVWNSIVESLDPKSKITVLSNGPLTNLAKLISSNNISSVIQDIYIVGGHITQHDYAKGNIFTIPSNEHAEFNIFLDPLAAKAVFESKLDITLIPISTQRIVSSFHEILNKLQFTDPPELDFARRLLSRLQGLQQKNHRYHHMDMFLGEILGAVTLGGTRNLNPTFVYKPLKIVYDGDESKIGQIVIDERRGKLVRILESVNRSAYYDSFGSVLRDQRRSAVIGSFDEQAKIWSEPTKMILAQF